MEDKKTEFEDVFYYNFFEWIWICQYKKLPTQEIQKIVRMFIG